MAKKLKIFTKKDCPKCPEAKKIGKDLEKENGLEIEYYDVEEAEGLAEAQLYSILATPSLILCQGDGNETEIKSWRGEAPDSKEAVLEEMK